MGVEQHLEEAFGTADASHFFWQTRAVEVADQERVLVRSAFLPLGARVLDLGCGEGATLLNLGAPEGAVGVDLFEDKLAFARTQLPQCEFRVASAYELPFEAGRFDQILVRDLIHHLEQPERMVAECHRVLAANGRIDVLEPCRYNPLIFAHGATQPAERGELRSCSPFLQTLLASHFQVDSIATHQALPIHRIVYHPKLGRPQLANTPWVRRLVKTVESIAGKVIPPWARAYIHVRASRLS